MKTLCLIFILAWPVFAIASPPDSTSRRVKTSLVNPFRNIKTSVYFQYGGGPLLGMGYGGGVEFRRFTSIRSYVFLDVEWCKWRKEEGLSNYFYMDGRYLLNTQAAGTKFGLSVAQYSAYVGARYLTDAYLQEDVVSTLDLDSRDYFEGNITPYAKPVLPVVGINGKFKLWSIVFFEFGWEVWFNQKRLFKDLETNWKAPKNYSPFLSRDTDKTGYYYGAIHVKL